MNKPPISEMELHSFIDGQLVPEEQRRIEQIMTRDNELAREAQELQQLKTSVQNAYKTVSPPMAPPQPASRSGRRLIGMAAVLLFAVGGLSGWLLNSFGNSRALPFGIASAMPKGVVIQVSDDDPAKWQMALINAQNVRKALGDTKVSIEIVAYGPGLKMLLADSSVAPALTEAGKNGVKLLACGNTMTMMHTTRAELNHLVDVVPTGVVEIMQRQKEGYAYVRP